MTHYNLYSHVDVRVRERERAVKFYDQVFSAMGLSQRPGEVKFVTYGRAAQAGSPPQWFGLTVEPEMVAGSSRVCFNAKSRAEVDRLAEAARNAGACNFEPAHEAYGPQYYATFFDDPDGNRLEVAYVEEL